MCALWACARTLAVPGWDGAFFPWKNDRVDVVSKTKASFIDHIVYL